MEHIMKIKFIILISIMAFICTACANIAFSTKKNKLVNDSHLILGSVEYVKKIQDFANIYGNRKAFSELMNDVNKYGNELNNIDPNNIHNNIDPKNIQRFNKLVSSLVYKIGYVDMEMHYFRNKLNRVPKNLKELMTLNKTLPVYKRWRLLGITSSEYHIQGTDGEYNLKFLSFDGFYEAVYNKKGILQNEKNNPVDMGTYNFAAGMHRINAHGKFDVSPYLKWGNSPNSPQKGSAAINKGVHSALNRYKKFAANVFLYRRKLFGMQQGGVL
jgi:hypothetical protein